MLTPPSAVASAAAPRAATPAAPAPSADAGLTALDAALDRALAGVDTVVRRGRVVEVVGGLVKVVGAAMRIGELCALRDRHDRVIGHAEVVGFSGAGTYVSALGPLEGLSAEVQVVPLGRNHRLAVHDGLLGRVLDGFGAPIDAAGPLASRAGVADRPVDAPPPDPLRRRPIAQVFETGIRSIDTLLTLGVGQRVGIFAPPGVGKSTLLAQLARQAHADVVVVALVGERGREVGDFVRQAQADGTLARTVVVAASADRTAAERIKAAQVASTIAEGFRDAGRDVLLMVDSVTRLARAQREVGLSIGEPPTRRGFPPSVFSQLPRLLERSGQGEYGSITAFYTVLTEGQADDDPIAEEVQATLDGHIVLSRELASAGVYPAIDVLASISRLMNALAGAQPCELAARARRAMARYREVELLLQIGEYERGVDAESDLAVATHGPLREFLHQQAGDGAWPRERSLARLAELMDAAR